MSDIPNARKPRISTKSCSNIYDYYIHGHIDRRTFLDRAAKFAVGSLTAVALLEMLTPNYAWATEVPKDDPRVKSELLKYSSPKGNGKNGEMEGPLRQAGQSHGEAAGCHRCAREPGPDPVY
jgi:carboxymethylenebutenolidase